MTIAEIFTVLAGVTFAVSSFLYVRDTIRAKITPSIATFGILAIVNFSQLIALIAKDVWHVVPFTTVGFLQALIVFVIAVKGGKFYFRTLDFIALLGAVLGFVVWLTQQDAAYNIYILNAVIAITFVPLIVKAFKEPALETKLPWQSNLLASIFLLFTITSTAPYVWIVPVRQFICSLLINIGISLPRVKTPRSKSS
jgi:hypothetical protein